MSTVYAGCGNEYEHAVNNRLSKEDQTPDFTKQKRTWGERVGNSPVIEHKGKFYFEYNNLNANWNKSETKFYTTNSKRMIVELTQSELDDLKRNYLPIPSAPKNQGTINPVLIRDVEMDTIIEFKGFGLDLKKTITI